MDVEKERRMDRQTGGRINGNNNTPFAKLVNRSMDRSAGRWISCFWGFDMAAFLKMNLEKVA